MNKKVLDFFKSQWQIYNSVLRKIIKGLQWKNKISRKKIKFKGLMNLSLVTSVILKNVITKNRLWRWLHVVKGWQLLKDFNMKKVLENQEKEKFFAIICWKKCFQKCIKALGFNQTQKNGLLSLMKKLFNYYRLIKRNYQPSFSSKKLFSINR